MKSVRDFEVKNKRVLVRCDFNVPLSDKGNVLDDYRIKKTIPTIEYLVKKGAKVVLMSHLGGPDGKAVEGLRLTPVQDKLIKYLGFSVAKAPDCIGPEAESWTEKMQSGEVLLLENLRFHREEEENDGEFAKELAKLGDIYINDAFGVCHRSHASVIGIPKHLPSGAGLLLEKEIKVLSGVIERPKRPLVSIIGGVKIASKIKVIGKLLEVSDHLLVGGEIANTILNIKRMCVERPSSEDKVAEMVKNIELTNPKLHLPLDGRMGLSDWKEPYFRIGAMGTLRQGEKIYDLGPETIRLFSDIVKSAKTVIWSGPLGFFEQEKFAGGSRAVAEAVVKNHSAFKVAGGGDTDSFLAEYNLRDKFDHVSTGGGAMLEFLSGEKLPGIKALN